MNNNQQGEQDQNKKNQKVITIAFVIIAIIVLGSIISSSSSKSNSSNKNTNVYSNQSSTVNKVYFDMSGYTLYQSDTSDNNYYAISVTIRNDDSVQRVISKSDIQIKTSGFNLYFVQNNTFYDEITIAVGETKNVVFLYCGNKNIGFSSSSIEIDFSMLSLGHTFSISKLKRDISQVSFEKDYYKKMGIKENNVDKIIKVVKDESLGTIEYVNYSHDELLDEDNYVLSFTRGYFSFSFDSTGKLNMMDLQDNAYYDIYVDDIRNPYYLFRDELYAEYNKGTWQQKIKTVFTNTYPSIKFEKFTFGRLSFQENGFGIQFNCKGENAYGATLYKSGIVYVDYNITSKEFIDYYWYFDGSTISDDRVTVSFNTFCTERISDQKVSKNYYITRPATPKREGYEFKYWYYKGEWDFSKSPTSDMTLAAKWEEIDLNN